MNLAYLVRSPVKTVGVLIFAECSAISSESRSSPDRGFVSFRFGFLGLRLWVPFQILLSPRYPPGFLARGSLVEGWGV